VLDLLPKITVPALVLHVRDGIMTPANEGRRFAAAILGSKFVSLPGKNHAILENDPGAGHFLGKISYFLRSE
jgi:pimeloyl-ACP methyl ester carboxylesterase